MALDTRAAIRGADSVDGYSGTGHDDPAADALYAEAQTDMAAGRWEAATGKLNELAARNARPAPSATREDVQRAREQYQARRASVHPAVATTTVIAPTLLAEPRGRARGTRLSWPRLLAGGIVVLGLLCVGLTAAGLQARDEILARNAAIATQQQTIDEVTVANLHFQRELASLHTERDELLTRVQAADATAVQMRGRAEKAESRGSALADVVKVDEEIYAQVAAFLQEIETATRAIARRDYVAALTAYSRLERISNQLKPLFERRKSLTSRI